jgi:hypothetical protein
MLTVLTQNPANCCDGEAGGPRAQRHTNPPYAAEIRAGAGSWPPMQDGPRKAYRAARSPPTSSSISASGLPDGVAAVANEEKIGDLITLSARRDRWDPGEWHGFRRGAFCERGGPDVAFRGLVQADQFARSKSPSSTRGSLAPAASSIILRIAPYIARSNRE